MRTLIMKFGGTSVGMTTGLTQLLSIVLHEREHWDRLLVVVSALEGVTDQLLEAAHLAQLANRRGYRRIVTTLLRQNKLLSVAIDATDIIITDNIEGNATPNLALSSERIQRVLEPMLERSIIPVITGFIGATTTGTPTTLGRGGSDYTASVLGVCIGADEVWIWTDVDGMMSADPQEIPNARVIPSLSYEETAELAYFGARILHNRMIAPLHERRIPLRVRNVFRPQGQGTIIGASTGDTSTPKAITLIHGIAVSAAQRNSFASVAAHIDAVWEQTIGGLAEVMLTSQSAQHSLFAFVIPTSAGPEAPHALHLALSQALAERSETRIWTVRSVSIVTLIGTRLEQARGLLSAVIAALDDIPVLAIAHSPGRCALSIAIDPGSDIRAMTALHDLILKTASGTAPAPRP